MESVKRLAYNGKTFKDAMGITFTDVNQFDGQKTKEEVEDEQVEQKKDEKKDALELLVKATGSVTIVEEKRTTYIYNEATGLIFPIKEEQRKYLDKVNL